MIGRCQLGERDSSSKLDILKTVELSDKCCNQSCNSKYTQGIHDKLEREMMMERELQKERVKSRTHKLLDRGVLKIINLLQVEVVLG